MNINYTTLHLYWQQIKKYKPSFFTALIALPLTSLCIDSLLPYFFSQVIGALTIHDQAAMTHNLMLAAIAGGLGIASNALGFQMLVRHEGHVRSDLSDATFAQLINKDMRFLVNQKVGGLTSKFIDFVRSHVVLQDLLIIRTLGFALTVSVGLVIVATQSLVMAGVIVVLIIGLIVQVRWSIKKRAPYRHARKKMTSEIHGKIADTVTNNLIVKTFAKEGFEAQRLARDNRAFRRVYLKDLLFLSAEGSVRIGVMTIAQVVSLGLCAALVMNGAIALATAVFVITYLQRLASQLFTLGEMLNGYDQALLEAQPMTEILTEPTTVNDAPSAQPLDAGKPTIELQKISYQYDDAGDTVLHDVSLTIPAGQKVGLVGHSGAGKTTLTHLLLRFADVTDGAILINGQDIREVTQSSLRSAIAYVPQDPKLFHRSLRENIAYGLPDISDKAIIKAARRANAYEFIEKLPAGLDTIVGEHGIKLSGGQRQRVAIARAILKDAPILILDEATSALDSASEKLIQEALAKLMTKRTSIVVAHRLSTIAKLDRIIVMQDGAIVEDGTHQQLLNHNGIYATLWAHQSGGFIEE